MRLNLGKTPEEQAIEEAKKQKEREIEIQKATLERQQKIEALHRKQKLNKIIIIGVSSLLIVALGVFGTYNTFFKKDINIEDVKSQINRQVVSYPSEGLDNYIRDISQTLFINHIGFDTEKYASAEIDKNSVYISRVKKINNVFSQVYFMADVVMTEKDTKVTDKALLANLKANGQQKITTTVTRTASAASTTTASSDVSSSNVSNVNSTVSDVELNTSTTSITNTSENTSENVSVDTSIDSSVTETSDESVPENTTNSTIVNTDTTITLNNDSTEYYMIDKDTYMQKGKQTTQRYTFMIPVEYYYNYNEQNVPVSSGYKVVGKLELYPLEEVDVFEEPESFHEYYAFDEKALVDESTLASAKQTVNKILSDIYAGTVLPQDFVNARQFNTYGASYVRLDDFAFYTTTNPLGYNAVVTYTIQMTQGFLYTTTSYLVVEPNDTSWKITSIS